MHLNDHIAAHLAPHPEHDALHRRLRQVVEEPVAWRGVLYRSAAPKYAAREDRLDGIGSALNGGRWNPIGARCVYGSASPETAMIETLATQRYYGLPPQGAMPRTFFAFEAMLTTVIDLTLGNVRRRLRISLQSVLECDWRTEQTAGREAWTQTIGRSALRAGAEALIVPSAADVEGRNLVVFPSVLRPESRLIALNVHAIRGSGG